MQFEILNTIKFVVYVLVMAAVYWKLKSVGVVKTSWKTFSIIVIIATLFTYQQFFTLTEFEDIKSSQQIMEKQSSQIRNGNSINQYLKENKKVIVDKVAEREAELLNQKQKSKKLADELNTAQKD
tara:strand:- start:71 stop:445 length:375 start_codon:yes stop_codon:yes gene_type:complete